VGIDSIEGTERAQLLDGTAVSAQIKQEVAEEVTRLRIEHGIQPRLVVVRVGEDPASAVYVNSKVRTSLELGLASEQIELSFQTQTAELLKLIEYLNGRDEVDGILVQLPLPGHVSEQAVLDLIDPAKDVDGFHPINVGKLALGQPALAPCTPLGVIELLERSGVALKGANACVVGRSNIVGRPLAQLLLQRDATVTICHSRTRNLSEVTRAADILIAAIGRPGFIRGEHIAPGATVIDVGINRVSDPAVARELFGADLERRLGIIEKRGYTIVGDVNPNEAEKVAGRITPVPGGVGPLTVAMLMKNTLDAAKRRRNLAW
jgi:methylenetetrahydrofolate dehydrogenase (NADP+)/methenyltetrahydrofolate cyclohydrolase